MSAPSKRHASPSNSEVQSKLSHTESQIDSLKKFMNWADTYHFKLNEKVTVGREGSCAQYGMVAINDIPEGEVLFEIQRNMLLHPGTTAIKELLEEHLSSLEGKSGWIPLLVSLMYEYNNPTSLWRPYLDLVPDFKELDLPMFWSSAERGNLLSGTGVTESVSRDLKNLETEFTEIVQPFILKHMDKFTPVCKDLEFYKKMVAFVMAYSFTEPTKEPRKTVTDTDEDSDEDDDEIEEIMSPPMMVPMADILNHVAKNNARLTFETDALKMVTVTDIKKGEEVFNTYGELSNSHLLHMYGFAEPYPNNHFDEVSISGCTLMEAAKRLECNSEEILNKKKTVLQNMGLIDTTFVVGTEGVLTEDEMCQALKIWTMSPDNLTDFIENDGWIEDGLDDESLLFDSGLEKLPKDMKQLLHRCAVETLNQYKTTLEKDEADLLKDTITSRQRYSLYVTYGQKKILKKLINCLS